ncbi:unnamed protein product [Phytomonas sp. Hart1]|nr:unnamed protein product [Phytomonas sp. Hart1]|eukprot:CCW70430.1 unnamed protein product [Phytomonas sp. isolate Hart1]
MRSSANRDAFLREMGITHDDIINPDDRVPNKDALSKSKTSLLGSGGDLSSRSYKSTGVSAYPKDPSIRADAAGGTAFAAISTNPARPRDEVEELKIAGNNAFERGHFAEAIRLYSEAIKCHGETSAKSLSGGNEGFGGGGIWSIPTPASAKPSAMLLTSLYSNRSAAFMQAAHDPTVAATPEAAYQKALGDAEQAVALRPDWFKPYSRQGDSYFKLRQYHQAAEAYQMALCMEPGNLNLANSLKESQERAKSSVLERLKTNRRVHKEQGGGGYAPPTERMNVKNPPEAARVPPSNHPTLNSAPTVNPTNTTNPRNTMNSTQTVNSKNTTNTRNTMNSTHTMNSTNTTNTRNTMNSTHTMNSTNTTNTRNTMNSTHTVNSGNISAPSQVLFTPEEYRHKQLEEFRRKREERVKKSSLTEDGLTESFSVMSPDTMQNSKCHSVSSGGVEDSIRSLNNIKNDYTTKENSNKASAIFEEGPERRIGNQNIPYKFSSEAATAYQKKLLEEFRRKKATTSSF